MELYTFMTKTDHKNITYMPQHDLYRVNLMRKSEVFNAYFKTLQDAIDVRDKVHSFYDTHGVVPTLEDLALDDLHLSEESDKNIVFHEHSGLWRLCIHRNKQRFVAYAKTRDEAVTLRSKVISFYKENSRMPSREEIDSSYVKRSGKSETLRYLSYDKASNKWRFRITRNKVRLNATLDTLEQAQKYRDSVLSFYSEHRRLPQR